MKQTMALIDFMAETGTSMIEAIGIIDQLHELEKDGKNLETLTDSYVATFVREPVKRVQKSELIKNYFQFKLREKSELKSEYNKNYFQKKKVLKRERKSVPPSSPFPPTPPISPISPFEKERENSPQSATHSAPPGACEPKITHVFPAGFDEFYDIYPKKVGKQDAIKAWRALKADDTLIHAIIADVNRRINGEWKGADKHFIPHPATYIRGRRWEDETQINERIEVSKDWHNPALNYTQRDYGDTQHPERVYMTFDDEEG